MTTRKPPGDVKPPSHLKPATKKWFASVVEEFELAGHHLRQLIAAAEAWDRLQEARATLDRDGLTYTDRFGAPRARPEVSIERDSRVGFLRALRELDLDVDPPPPSRRP